jgi:hypothetical protein
MLSRGVFSTHTTGVLVRDDTLQLLYYDRSVVVVVIADAFSFLSNHRKFFAWLMAMSQRPQLCTRIIWEGPTCEGMPEDESDPHFGMILRHPSIRAKGSTLCSTEDEIELEILLYYTLYRQHVIFGRGTFVIQGKIYMAPSTTAPAANLLHTVREEWEGANEHFVVKISLPTKTRTSEKTFVDAAYNVVCKNNQKPWRVFLDSLPKIFLEADIEGGMPNLEALFPGEYEHRVLRVLVMECLFPLDDIVDPGELAQVYIDIVKGICVKFSL